MGSIDAPLPPSCLAAADVATERFCADHPDLLIRYGERGRAYTHHDFAYLFAWAVDAVALDDPATFSRNVTWLGEILASRTFPMEWYVTSVRMTRAIAVERGLVTDGHAARLLDPAIESLSPPA